MTILLTGITGNLGSALFLRLQQRGHQVIPVLRADTPNVAEQRLQKIFGPGIQWPAIISANLEQEIPLLPDGRIDGIIHSAGSIRFTASEKSNARMARTVTQLAHDHSVPLFHVSTAFVWKQNGGLFRNAYEEDKSQAEDIIQTLSMPWAIFRPSILTGHSQNGHLLEATGYHHVFRAFQQASMESKENIRFPRFTGTVNIVPIDLAASMMVNLVEQRATGIHFITNTSPPSSDWVMRTGFRALGCDDRITFLDCSLEDYSKLPLTKAEQKLLHVVQYFAPYWTGNQTFPTARTLVPELSEQYLSQTIAQKFPNKETRELPAQKVASLVRTEVFQ